MTDMWSKLERAAANKIMRRDVLRKIMERHPYTKAERGARGRFVKAELCKNEKNQSEVCSGAALVVDSASRTMPS